MPMITILYVKALGENRTHNLSITNANKPFNRCTEFGTLFVSVSVKKPMIYRLKQLYHYSSLTIKVKRGSPRQRETYIVKTSSNSATHTKILIGKIRGKDGILPPTQPETISRGTFPKRHKVPVSCYRSLLVASGTVNTADSIRFPLDVLEETQRSSGDVAVRALPSIQRRSSVDASCFHADV